MAWLLYCPQVALQFGSAFIDVLYPSSCNIIGNLNHGWNHSKDRHGEAVQLWGGLNIFSKAWLVTKVPGNFSVLFKSRRKNTGSFYKQINFQKCQSLIFIFEVLGSGQCLIAWKITVLRSRKSLYSKTDGCFIFLKEEAFWKHSVTPWSMDPTWSSPPSVTIWSLVSSTN